ncbi:MAG TPA: TRAP transporter fused permease subunit [Alphaproteobacteria bacterium]|nr:TRAP transporter fused permease subunit [Alphaproteobacteria bacterium]
MCLLKINSNFNERITITPKFIIILLTIFGCLITINQVFNFGIFNFYPVSNSFLYLLIAFFQPLSFLLFPISKKYKNKILFIDVVAAISIFFIGLYFSINSENILSNGWDIDAPILPTILSFILIILSLESLRRTGGKFIFYIAIFFTLYPIFADHMPGALWGNMYSITEAARAHSMGLDSLIGIPMRVAGSLLIGFLIYGIILAETGGGKFFINIAESLMGKYRGGPAKVAVLASGFFGMLSGSPTSNVITSGSLTIPAMKKAGYSGRYAAAIEACASTGGVLMPPVMGTVAFIMASFLNLPYSEILFAALIPGIIFYIALIIQTDLYAAKNNLKGMELNNIPKLLPTITNGFPFIMSFICLVWLIMSAKLESEAPFISSLFLIIILLLRNFNKIKLNDWLNIFIKIGEIIARIVSLLSGVGVIIGAMSLTGVGTSLSRELVFLAGGDLFMILIFGAIASLVLGIGMTVSACYIFLAIVLAPAIIEGGISPLAAHLYVLYWGVLSFITPPVAIAAITASSISNTSALKTGFLSMRLGSILFFLPILFVFDPSMLMQGTAINIIFSVSMAIFAIIIISAGFEGYMYIFGRLNKIYRILCFSSGLLILMPNLTSKYIGIGILIITTLSLILTNLKNKNKL